MAYDNNKPQPTDSLAQSQPVLLENFVQLDTQFAIDHIAFSNGVAADEGEHKKISLNDVEGDPGLIFPKSSIYTKHVGVAGDRFTSLYFEADPENAATTDTPFLLNSIKAWVRFVGNGVIGAAATVVDSYNVSGVNRDTAALFTISFSSNLTNINYGVLATSSADGSIRVVSTSVAIGSVQLQGGSIAMITAMIIGT